MCLCDLILKNNSNGLLSIVERIDTNAMDNVKTLIETQ